MDKRHIVLVDDTKALAEMYALALGAEGYQVTIAYSGTECFHILETDSFAPDLLILDVKLPDMDGLQMLARLKERAFDAPVIIITGHGSIHMAVEAMRLGATDFIVKPFSLERLTESVSRALDATGLATKAEISLAEEDLDAKAPETENKGAVAPTRTGFGGFIGISPPMQLVYDVIESAAKSSATVFITGESGTGKEICAEAIHRYSRRANEPFIAINCAAIPRELLESELFGHMKGAFTGAFTEREGAVGQANGGTLFLDEIAEMAPEMQTKLLRFLQNLTYRKVGGGKMERANVRIVCATNRDPIAEIRAGNLRQDLYYRLHVIPIHMPPLRVRKTDIIDLADYFLKQYAREEGKSFKSFAQDAENVLTNFSWPGNVRQLQNIVRGIAVLHEGRYVTAPMLPMNLLRETESSQPQNTFLQSQFPHLKEDEDNVRPLWKVERTAIENAIALCEGNIPKAAALLEISPSTIYRKKMVWDKHTGEQTSHYF
ncbi:MAG: sigma-54-dependent Fis family transcriptional regulator [Micavibrio aeruginosavorus]|uniref:Sigma-54-dependent Fis family transcriptional regulator n=1 Tax=Micavibrio aeruginosavorus TaxID=349221 RepID=A0A2W5QCF5_9BACT|nr:MAG: sigma-54-dependent Fis family transcriptional regulator [Micavibrio aeruginosavorus]